VIFSFLVDRISLFDSIEIEPRPVFAEEILPRPINEPIAPVIAAPTPSSLRPDPAHQIAQAAIASHTIEPADQEHEASESDVLLPAITILAKKEQPPPTRTRI
jgi:hypothetical protein